MTVRRPWPLLMLGLVVLSALPVLGVVALPLFRLVEVAREPGGPSFGSAWRSPGLAAATEHSLALAFIVPLLTVPIGTAMTLLLRQGIVHWCGLLRVLVVLPLVVPQFVLGYSWVQAYDRAGFTDHLLGVHWTSLDGPIGVVVALVVDAVPLCFLLSSAALAVRSAPELEAAARVSGSSTWSALRTVTLPLLRPMLLAELVLTFVLTLESFAIPQVLGTPAGFSTLTTRIYGDLALGSDPNSFIDAVRLALGLVIIAAVVLLPADLLLSPALRTTRTGDQPAAGLAIRAATRTVFATAAVLGYCMLAVLLPTLALLSAAVTRAIGRAPSPANWTLDNFRTALDAPTLSALWHSLELATEAAFTLTVLGVLIAVLERRRGGRGLSTLTALTFAIPGSTLAVGLLIAYGRWFDGGLLLILIAYLAKFWALAHRAISGALDRFPNGEWQAARASGAGPLAAVRTVWLPALAPALLGAWVLVFLAALHEVTMSSLLYTGSNQTIAVAVLNSQELGAVGPTAALSVILTLLVVLGALPAWIVLRAISRRRTRRPPSAQLAPVRRWDEAAHA